MGRIKIVLALLSVMVMVVAAAAPAAMAANNHNNKQNGGNQNNKQNGGNQNNKQHGGNNGGAFFVVNDDNDFDHNGFDNGFDIDQDIDETGDIDLNTEIVNTGNNSNQCAAPLQFGNTGNFQNAQGFTQLDSFADDIEFDGGSFEFLPEQAVDCGQGVFQSAASG